MRTHPRVVADERTLALEQEGAAVSETAIYTTRLREYLRGLDVVICIIGMSLVATVLVVSLVYAFLAYPQSDDLIRTAARRTISAWSAVQNDYNGLDSRWASLYLQYICYTGDNLLALYPWILSSLLLIGLVGCCCAVAVISGHRLTEPAVLATGLVAYAFLWLSAPMGEPFYWLPGSMGYWLPPALGMILLWSLRRATGWTTTCFAIVLAFLLPAFHEVCGGWVVGVLGVASVILAISKRRTARRIAMVFVAGCLGLATVIAAPGPHHRMAISPHLGLTDALANTSQVISWVTSHQSETVPLLVLILLAAVGSKRRPDWYTVAPLLAKVSLALGITAFPVVVFTATSVGLGGVPARLADGVYFIDCAGIAAFVAACGFDLGRWAAANRLANAPWGTLVRVTVTVLAIFQSSHLPRAQAALRELPLAVQNRATLDQRTAEILAQRQAGARDILVHYRMIPLTILPTNLDLRDGDGWFINDQMAKYFDVDKIRLAPAAPAMTGHADGG